MQIQLLGADQRVVALLSCCLETGSQQQVFKLPDIARPVILPQLFQRQGMQANLAQSQLASGLIQKVAAEYFQILFMLPQGGHGNGIDP